MTIHHHHYNKYSLPLGYVVHVVAFIISSTGLTYNLLHIGDEGQSLWHYKGWPGKPKYLTFWCEVVLPIYFFLCIVNDLLGTNTTDRQHFIHRSGLQTARDWIHSCLAFPIGIFVSTTFWVIYAIDRELVYPKELDKVIPVWHNHIVHTGPLVFLLLEKIFVNIVYPPRKFGALGPVLLGLVYQSWILWIAHTENIWVYPILEVLGYTQRALFMGGLSLFLVAVYFFGHWLSKELWWGPDHEFKKKK